MKWKYIGLGLVLIIIGTNLWTGILYSLPYGEYILPSILIIIGILIFLASREKSYSSVTPLGKPKKKTRIIPFLLGVVIFISGLLEMGFALQLEIPIVEDYLTGNFSPLIITIVGLLMAGIGLFGKSIKAIGWAARGVGSNIQTSMQELKERQATTRQREQEQQRQQADQRRQLQASYDSWKNYRDNQRAKSKSSGFALTRQQAVQDAQKAQEEINKILNLARERKIILRT